MANLPPAGAPFSANLGIYSALAAIKPNSGEAPVFILWTTLCATYFHPGEGFKTAVGRPALRDDTELALAVIEVWSARRNLNVPEDLHENQVLFIECKRPSRDTPVEWASASEQLTLYCRSNANVSRRFLAATAIGTKVKFWQYDAPSLHLESDVPTLSPISGCWTSPKHMVKPKPSRCWPMCATKGSIGRSQAKEKSTESVTHVCSGSKGSFPRCNAHRSGNHVCWISGFTSCFIHVCFLFGGL